MGLLWYFLLALGFLVVIMISVPSDDTPPPEPPPFSQGTGAPVGRLP